MNLAALRGRQGPVSKRIHKSCAPRNTSSLFSLSIASLHDAEPKPWWQNITTKLAKKLGVDAPRELPPKAPGGKVQKTAIYMKHFQGLFVLPNGDVGVINIDKGLHRSTDQGAT